MDEDFGGIERFGHGLGPRKPGRSTEKQPAEVAKRTYGHGLGPRMVLHAPEGLPEAPDPLSPAQKRTLTIALVALGTVTLGIGALIHALDAGKNCPPASNDSENRCASGSGGSGGHGSGGGASGGGGSYGHGVSFGGFGGTGAAHGGGGT